MATNWSRVASDAHLESSAYRPILRYPCLVQRGYIVKLYMEGDELLDLFTEYDQLSEKTSMQAIRKVLQTINYRHARGVVQGDVVPENILLVNRTYHL